MPDFKKAKQAFDRDGFVVLRSFLGDDETTDLIDNVDRYINKVVPTVPPENAFYEDTSDLSTLKQLPHMQLHDSYFNRMLNKSPFRELAEMLLDGEVVPKNAQYLCKPPQIGQATPPHQDGYYFMIEPVEALTMWIGMDHADEENGCLRYVNGSHRLGLRPHSRTQTLGFSQGITDFGNGDDLTNEKAYTASPGDVLAHHALAIHRADSNRSIDRPRRAIGLVYLSSCAKEHTEELSEYRRKLADDLTSKGRI